ncbi:hypothetical protein [Gulosibacter sp. ACHW.36C]|uniref:Uncharacterized protein n=1 Tax=Gulosibacter sediminis TaxID=1729695 RepID=A0ABY4MZ88_9MICO|nr:hypothetical protein [Gulosibacter sediminis]UQN15750.1 hypothetical protein M3M28_04665 [Gulosibacter sediminis]
MITPAEVPGGTGLTIGVGLDTVTDPAFDWDGFANLLERAGATGVALLVGRPELLGFPWNDHEERWAPRVTGEVDPIARALAVLAASEADPEITLVIDVTAPRHLQHHPADAGVFADGVVSEQFPSIASLARGQVGADLVALCREVSDRYQPARITLTSLILEATFGESDRELFADMTGLRDFPRDEAGHADELDPVVVAWRTRLLTELVAQSSSVTLPGTLIDVEMRVNWDEPGADRADSGHAYAAVLGTGNAITLWDSFGLNDEPPTYSAQLADGLAARFGVGERERVTISIGLWGRLGESDGATISPFDLRIAVENTWGMVGHVEVTPASLLEADHWRVLAELRESRIGL